MNNKIMLVFSLLLFAGTASIAQGKHPNIILILADDLGYGDLGCYGQQMIHTPNIDRLAEKGMKFTDYYAGCSVCAPSRETLLTGMHTGHTAIRGNFRLDVDDGNLPMSKDHRTIAEYLQTAGYHTGLFGKWGIGDSSTGPNTRGFDYSLCYMDQIKAHDYYPPYLWENDQRIVLKENENGRHGIYSHHLFADRTLDFIRNNKTDQPFFLYLAYTIPHGDYTLPPDTPYAEKNWPKNLKTYATMISLLDRDVSRIVSLLKEKGIEDNTIILFTSDNGANPGPANFFHSNGPLRGAKFGLYEGGIREPLIVCWPGKIKPAQTSHHISASWDMLPTLCQMAGLPPPAGIDGISFLPALTDRRQKDHAYLYWEYYEFNYNWHKPGDDPPRNWLDSKAARIGKWKADLSNIYKNKNAAIELYDLEDDPGEKKNVADQHPEIVQKAKEIFSTSSIADPPYFPYQQNK